MRFALTVPDGSSCPNSHSLNMASKLSYSARWFALKGTIGTYRRGVELQSGAK